MFIDFNSPLENRAWNYNPGSGRFLSEDPIGLESGDFNLYRYVFNNSLLLKDPNGLRAFATEGVLLGQIAGVKSEIILEQKALEEASSEAEGNMCSLKLKKLRNKLTKLKEELAFAREIANSHLCSQAKLNPATLESCVQRHLQTYKIGEE